MPAKRGSKGGRGGKSAAPRSVDVPTVSAATAEVSEEQQGSSSESEGEVNQEGLTMSTWNMLIILKLYIKEPQTWSIYLGFHGLRI